MILCLGLSYFFFLFDTPISIFATPLLVSDKQSEDQRPEPESEPEMFDVLVYLLTFL